MKRMRRLNRQRGAVALMVALLFAFVFIGVVGIVIDLGRLFISKTELQNAADACALAAAREINVETKTLAVLTRAESAGITVGNRHRYDFQHEQVQFVTDQDVEFSEYIDHGFATKTTASQRSRFVRCTRRIEGYAQWATQLLWLGGSGRISPVGASAVAYMGGASGPVCAIPLGMCIKATTPTCVVSQERLDSKFNLCRGQWYDGRFEPGGSATGSFNFLDFTAHGGGANELAGQFQKEGICERKLEVGDVIHGELGMNNRVKAAWNSRFGLYGPENLDPASAVPDFTGFSYGPTNWPSAHDAYPDYVVRQGQFASFGYPADSRQAGEALTGLDIKNFDPARPSGTSGPYASGSQRRLVTMPLVDCSAWDSSHQVVFKGWACALMVTPAHKKDKTGPGENDDFSLEYLGEAGVEGVPCGTYGQGGGSGPPVPTLVR